MKTVIVCCPIGEGMVDKRWIDSIFKLNYTPIYYLFHRSGINDGCSDVEDRKNYQKRNIQVTHSRNEILRMANKLPYDYLLWVDSDVEIPSDALTKMMAIADRGEEIVTAVGEYRQLNSVLNFKITKRKSWHKPDIEYAEWTGFLCVLISRRVHDTVGDFFANPIGEDVDYCQRAIKHKFGIAIANDVVVKHHYR